MTESAHALNLPMHEAQLPEDMRRYFARCREKLGFVPNVLESYAFDATKLQRSGTWREPPTDVQTRQF